MDTSRILHKIHTKVENIDELEAVSRDLNFVLHLKRTEMLKEKMAKSN